MFEILHEATKESGQIIRDNFNKKIKTSWKNFPQTDIVTEADIKSQDAIVKSLTESMINKGYKEEEVGFIAEEDLVKPAVHQFIIDPLDGTSDFAFGIERFAISIAYMKDQEVLAGIIYDPMRDATYFAEKGKGSHKILQNKREELFLEEKPLDRSLISFNSSSKKEKSIEMFNRAIKLTPHVLRIREQGAITIALMAITENKFQGHLNGRCSIWDIAAAKLILEEAGGTLLDFEGKEINYDLKDAGKKYEIIAGKEVLIKEILNYI